MKKQLILKGLLSFLLLFVGVNASWADTVTKTIVFDFEDDTAHRTSGTNSYSLNTYKENEVTISMNYFDAVSSTKVSGSYNATGRVAKNTTNSPVITLGPISITNKTITRISYKQNGATAISQVLEYSTDNSNWTTGIASFFTTSSTEEKATATLSVTGTNLYVRITASVGSSTSSNRDFYVDDITITYTEESSKTATATSFGVGAQSSYTVYMDDSFTAPTATVTGGDGLVPTYSSNNTDVATVDENTGAVTLVAPGTTTITASYAGNETYENSNASYTLTVGAVYASLQALQANTSTKAVPMKVTLTNAYVNGVTSNNKNAYISEGVYGALIFDNAAGLADLAGKKISGTLTANVQLSNGQTEITGFNTAGLTIVEETTTPVEVTDLSTITAANQSRLVTLKSVTFDGTYLVDANSNKVTPYATFGVATNNFTNGTNYDVTGVIIVYSTTKNTTIEIAPRTTADIVTLKSAPTASWTNASETLTIGNNVTSTFSTNSDGTLTYSSSDPSVASVNESTGEITINKCGKATITASTTETANYTALASSIKLYVISANTVFYESFDTNNGTGGNDGLWSGSIASSTLTSDKTGWTFAYEKGAKECAKFGTTTAAGSAKTPAITLTGAAKITFKAAAWDSNSEATTLNLSATSGNLSQTSVTMVKGSWTEYTVYLYGVSESTQITFAASQASNNRFFLDEVLVETTPSSVDIDITAAGYATYYNSAVAYEMPMGMEGYVWKNCSLSKAYDTGQTVPAGEPLVLKADKGGYALTFTTTSDNSYKSQGQNDLEGTDEETALTADASSYFYGLAVGTATGYEGKVGFYWMKEDGSAFTNGANKAYLKLAKSGGAKPGYAFNEDEATGINEVSSFKSQVSGKYLENGQIVIVKNAKKYNVNGQALSF